MKGINTPIEDMQPLYFVQLVAEYVLVARQQNGEEYKRDALIGHVNSILRHFNTERHVEQQKSEEKSQLADNVQVGINNPTNLPYVCPTCTCARCSSNTCADPCSSSQANPPTPNKTETQVPLVPVTIDLGATPAANTEPFPAPVYQAHSTGPGVPACGKFYQAAAATPLLSKTRTSASCCKILWPPLPLTRWKTPSTKHTLRCVLHAD
ncbi:hypothetical protein OEZ86_009459 [Tetradesmus obliquus]|nr:hypothetical protein OEZ86_009459 [Tetradesmus obliquus]